MKMFKLIYLTAAMLITACSANASSPDVKVVEPGEFKAALAGGGDVYLLDVRRPEEYQAGHLKGAHLLNWLDSESFKNGAAELDKSDTIYVYCRSGRRSGEAADYLASQGFKVVDMKGGILAWQQAGLPVTSSQDADQ